MRPPDQGPAADDEKLSDAERRLLAAAATGKLIDLRACDIDDDGLHLIPSWDRWRQIRASLLTELLTAKRQPDGNPPRAVKLAGARIAGPLNLEAADLTCPLLLLACDIDAPVTLDEATAASIRMLDCRLSALTARQLRTTGDLWLDGTSFTTGSEVDFAGAHIGGNLSMINVKLGNPGGRALTADRLTVDQNMFCQPGFTASGEIRLPGARIGGQLSMTGASLTNPGGRVLNADSLSVEADMFCGDGFTADGEISLSGAHIGGQLDLSGARLTNTGGLALNAGSLTVEQSLLCMDGFTVNGEIRLPGARIGGQLSMTGARLTNPGGPVLNADGLTVARDMICRDQPTADGEIRHFTADGAIILRGARIGAWLDLRGASLTGAGSPALNADSLTIGQNMLCMDGFTANGEIRLLGAHIGGRLDLSGARLTSTDSLALNADNLSVALDMFCRDESTADGEIRHFTVNGEIRLLGAHIGGQFDLSGAQLTSTGEPTLNADGLTVDQSMFCADGFTANGEVCLVGARIGRELGINGATLNNPDGLALTLAAANVTDLFLEPRDRPGGGVDLTDARVRMFYDNPDTWPAALNLRGFTYDSLGNEKVSTRRRLEWLDRHKGGYLPQLYDQLSAVYRRAGDEQAARTVAIAKQRRRRRAYSPLSWLWYVTVGYGYRPWLAIAWVIGLTALGTAVFGNAYPAHMIATSPHPPSFHAVGYALDLLLPVIGFGQKSAWQPQGGAYQYWSWALTAAGWVLTTAVVAGLTGILKRD
jgi:hypothetical protein